MQFVHNDDINDPRINLAIEEFLLRNISGEEPILLFYINSPSVIIGRNQNTIEEIDPTYVKEKGIHVVRRLSGGGAVYHDLGNLNFSFITQAREDLHNFAKFTEPVVGALRNLSISAELRGKSDIFANDRKISGNAQYSTNTGMFSHGTLLFDTDIQEMLRALNPRQVKVESKAVQSNRNFVTNIKELLPPETAASFTILDLKQAILDEIFSQQGVSAYTLTDEDWAEIHRISAERYQQWQWNYGHSPRFNIQKSGQFPVRKIDARIRIEVVKGHIQGIKIDGAFTGQKAIDRLENLLVGVRYDPEALAAAVADVDIRLYFGDLEKDAFLSLLF
ncbi:MAG: lipoate--protein ligase [Candidatus Promineifilaceae bacterium]